MDTGSCSSLYLSNPLSYLFNSTLCYVVSGVAILVVGVIITSVTFQNLDPFHEGNKGRFAGPVLMGAGILVMGRGAFYKLRNHECNCRGFMSRQRALIRRFLRREEEEDEQAIYLEPTDPDDFSSTYCDDPPPYHEAVAAHGSGSGLYPPISTPALQPHRYGAVVNPALEADDEMENSVPLQPPPPYEQVRHITQTSLP